VAVGVTFKIRRRGGRIKTIAEGLGALDNIGEVYLENPRLQMAKIRRIREYGHTDPMSLPRHITKWAREYIALAIKRGGKQQVRKAIRESTELIRDWLKTRLTSGRLGTQSAVTAKIKRWLIDHGRISRRYGYPPPLGIRSGNFLASIKSRMRRGTR